MRIIHAQPRPDAECIDACIEANVSVYTRLAYESRSGSCCGACIVPAAVQSACSGCVASVPVADVAPRPVPGRAGEQETTLNLCRENSVSCVSTHNDDEAHFLPPWSYDGTRNDAIARLVDVITGAASQPGLSSQSPA